MTLLWIPPREAVRTQEGKLFTPPEASRTALPARGARRPSAPRHAHMAPDGRAGMPSVDDEVMALRLARDRLVHGTVEQGIVAGGAHGGAQIGGVLLAKAHVESAGAGQAHPVAAFAEIMGHRRDEAEQPAGLAD